MVLYVKQPRCSMYDVNMENNILPEKIAEALKQFDRQKQSEEYHTVSNNAREIVSAIGTDTPTTILLDIRHILSEINTAIARQNQKSDEMIQFILETMKIQERSTEQRHNEMLAFMNKVSDSTNRGHISQSPSVSSQMKSLSMTESDGRYYYKGDEIKTNQAVVACFLMHLDLMISRTITMSNDITDTSIMELKDWSSAVTILREIDSYITPNRGILSIPKKTSVECTNALDIIASPVPGRTVTCKTEHIKSLIATCPTIANCVEEIRLRAIACPGIIPSSRLRRLSAISFPYVRRDDMLNITEHSPKFIGSTVLHESVRQMNTQQRKIYAQLVLGSSIKPMIASTTASNCKLDFKRWKEDQ